MKTNKWTVIGAMLCVAVWLGSVGVSLAAARPETIGGGISGAVVAEQPVAHKAWAPPIENKIAKPDKSPVMIFVRDVVGPYTNNPAYRDWAANTISNVYYIGNLPGQLPGALSHRLLPEYITQSSDMTNWTRWSIVQIISKDPGFMFTASQIRHFWKSSDTWNSLGWTNVFSNTNLIYSTWSSYGIVWGPSGQRTGDSVNTSGYWNAVPVNEVIFIGCMGRCYQPDLATTTNYLANFSDFSQTSTWQLMDSGGLNIIGSANRTMHTSVLPLSYPITIAKVPSEDVIKMSINSDPLDTWIMLYGRALPAGILQPVATVNAGDEIFKSTTEFNSGEWRLLLE